MNTNDLSLSVDGGGTNLLNPRDLEAEQILEFPMQLDPHSTRTGWLLFPLSKNDKPDKFQLTANAIRGTVHKLTFTPEEFQEADNRE